VQAEVETLGVAEDRATMAVQDRHTFHHTHLHALLRRTTVLHRQTAGEVVAVTIEVAADRVEKDVNHRIG
jgi:hypothetical protein